MWEWSDKLKLGKSSSAFVKRDLRPLPLTEAEFEADFFLDPESSTKRQERWLGMVIERESGAVLAMEDVQLPPPTVNYLANLLAHAMLRPLDYERSSAAHARSIFGIVPNGRNCCRIFGNLGSKSSLGRTCRDSMRRPSSGCRNEDEEPPSADEIKAALRKPFPERKRTWFTDAMALMEWSDAMSKGAYPSRKAPSRPMTRRPSCRSTWRLRNWKRS